MQASRSHDLFLLPNLAVDRQQCIVEISDAKVGTDASIVLCCRSPSRWWRKQLRASLPAAWAPWSARRPDLSLIRMQSDSTLPAAQRRNYKGVGDALFRRAAGLGSVLGLGLGLR